MALFHRLFCKAVSHRMRCMGYGNIMASCRAGFMNSCRNQAVDVHPPLSVASQMFSRIGSEHGQ